jgi:SAM-dependent methyltransferase
MITWHDDERFTVREGSTFRILPLDLLGSEHPSISIKDADFFLAKPRPLVERHLTLLEAVRPERVFELGIFQGGSTVFMFEVARPRKLVAIDRRAPLDRRRSPLSQYVSQAGVAESLRIYGRVDQGDRRRLAEIAREEFADEAIDLIVDDCSHLYEATRASFNELFPRLRPGGAYVIEDWAWAHAELGSEFADGMWPDEVPLTRLLFELVLSLPGRPGLVDRMEIDARSAVVTRGEAQVDPHEFDVAACSNPRGRDLLAG